MIDLNSVESVSVSFLFTATRDSAFVSQTYEPAIRNQSRSAAVLSLVIHRTQPEIIHD
jgi:hypothetical protein